MVPFSANADEMRDDRGGVRYAGLPRSTAARNSSTILWAELHGAVAALLFARQRQLMLVHRRRASRAARRASHSAAGCSAGTAANSPLAAADDVTTPSPQGPAAGRSSPLDILRAASEGIETKNEVNVCLSVLL